jgi:dual 3',5'-cyclic-AMP and -GMP phosphodiesterase 11
MSMTVCDLSAITKPWEIEKRVADLVSSEFFEQGDMERQELNITPIDIMNREKEDQLPMMQVGFIDSICLPIYEVVHLRCRMSQQRLTHSTLFRFRLSLIYHKI